MAEDDALSKFDFSSFGGSDLFLKFEAGKPITLRVLTTDPVVQQQEFTDEKTDEVTFSTKFCFVVYNFTDNKAQIMSASPTIAKKIGELHVDPEFGANIKGIDLRISPTGEKLTRRYDLQVLPKARELTQEQIAEARKINLDDKVKDGSRMSLWKPKKEELPDPIEDLGGEPINIDDIPF